MIGGIGLGRIAKKSLFNMCFRIFVGRLRHKTADKSPESANHRRDWSPVLQLV